MSSTETRITKRKLDDAISGLDDAVLDQEANELGPSPTKRPMTAKSIYASLSKYGFRKESKPTKPSRTPMLTNLLNRTKNSSLTRSSSNPTRSLPSISLPQALGPRPPYRPTSTADFLTRLETFKLSTYRDKPRATDAVTAARCGWKNDGQDRLVCDNCSAAWVVGSTAGMTREAANALTERQRTSMVTAHKETCPWRTRQCDASVYRIPLKGATALASEVKTQASALAPLVKDVVISHPLTPSQTTSINAALNTLTASPQLITSSSSSTTSETPAPALPETAIVMSLFGWQLYAPSPSPLPSTGNTASANRRASLTQSLSRASGSFARNNPTFIRGSGPTPGTRNTLDIPGPLPSFTFNVTSNSVNSAPSSPSPETAMVTCMLCQRRVGLWSFRAIPSSSEKPPHSPETSSTLMESSERPVAASRKSTQARKLDVLQEHRSYCPYVVKSTPLSALPQSKITDGSTSGSVADVSPAKTNRSEDLVEGWRAVLSIVGRAGMGARRRRNDLFGPVAAAGGSVDVEMAEDDGQVDAMVETVKRGGSHELLRYVKGLLG